MHSHNPPTESPYADLGKALKTIRVEKGWSLRKAADAIKVVSYSRLRDFECGLDPHSAIPTRPTEEQLLVMAKAYGVDPGPFLRLAGYSTVTPLTDWEEDLIKSVRKLDERQRHVVMANVVDLIGDAPAMVTNRSNLDAL